MSCARTACRLDPDLGEAWATLGFIAHRAGDATEARAALHHAVSLEGDNWRHHVRLAYVSWGEERLRACGRALQLLPGLALAHWLAASVHVARQSFDAAERELDAGADGGGAQRLEATRFRAVGLHWLRGLVRLRRGDERGALESFEHELALEDAHHLYARECCANTWYARGAVYVRRGAHEQAASAFDAVERRVAGHPLAIAARLAFLQPSADARQTTALADRLRVLRNRGAAVDAAVAEALADVARGRSDAAARHVLASLMDAPPGPAGWLIPVDPFLRTHEHTQAWANVLALLRDRAA